MIQMQINLGDKDIICICPQLYWNLNFSLLRVHYYILMVVVKDDVCLEEERDCN